MMMWPRNVYIASRSSRGCASAALRSSSNFQVPMLPGGSGPSAFDTEGAPAPRYLENAKAISLSVQGGTGRSRRAERWSASPKQ